MRLFLMYLKSRLAVILFFLTLLSVLCVVYGLYGLPWGPAFYTCILIACLGVLALSLGFYKFQRKRKGLEFLKKQVPYFEGFPQPGDPVEQAYQDLAKLLQSYANTREGELRERENTALAYYTRWSHQIKTPLAAAQLLLQEESLDREVLGRELMKVEQYVEMVLHYQRLEGDGKDLVLREYSLEKIVNQALKKVAPLFIYKRIQLRLGNLKKAVLTDEKWLVFIFEQLLTNAVKYTRQGTVSVYLQEGTECTVVVEDSGIGILAEDLPRVFEWGYTGGNGRLDKRSTGIGLALCRQAANMLGHSIRIESTKGVGTRVYLCLTHEQIEIE